jgi:hypothetical protein
MFICNTRRAVQFAAALGLSFFSLGAQASWQLVNESSQLNFISTKASHIAETHTFTELAGGISDTGQAELNIALESVATGIEVRNARMQSMLFNVVSFPYAKVKTAIDLSEFTAIDAPVVTPITAELSLVGQSTQVQGEVLVVAVDKDTVSVTTIAPIIVNAGALELISGIEALREVAGLPSISYSVPVTFSLIFRR